MKKDNTPIKKDISNFFKIPSELKKYFNSLLGSLGLIGLIWGGGAFFNSLSHKIDENQTDITSIKKEMVDLRKNIYNDVVDLNNLNNRTWNNKFIIYFNHNSDTEVIKNLLEMEDTKYEYQVKKIIEDTDTINKTTN